MCRLPSHCCSGLVFSPLFLKTFLSWHNNRALQAKTSVHGFICKLIQIKEDKQSQLKLTSFSHIELRVDEELEPGAVSLWHKWLYWNQNFMKWKVTFTYTCQHLRHKTRGKTLRWAMERSRVLYTTNIRSTYESNPNQKWKISDSVWFVVFK